MKTIKQFILENLENHLAVEDYYHNFYLDTLNEKYGVVEASKTLGSILSKKILDIAKNQKSEVILIDSIKGYFVDRFIINLKLVNNKIIQCSYQNCISNDFYVCQLNVILYKRLSEVPFDKFKNQIMHELLHAFEDYEKFKKNIDNSPSKEYEIAGNKLTNDTKTLEEIVSKIFYLIDVREINAYTQEMYSYLQNELPNIKFLNRYETNIFEYALNLLKESKVYKNYEEVLEFIDVLNSKSEISKLLFDIIRKEYDNYSTYSNEKILKILNKRKDRIVKKFQVQIPKMVYDFIEENIPKVYVTTNIEI